VRRAVAATLRVAGALAERTTVAKYLRHTKKKGNQVPVLQPSAAGCNGYDDHDGSAGYPKNWTQARSGLRRRLAVAS
jgi:hypothetical protein